MGNIVNNVKSVKRVTVSDEHRIAEFRYAWIPGSLCEWATGRTIRKQDKMLWKIVVVAVILWGLGLVGSYIVGEGPFAFSW